MMALGLRSVMDFSSVPFLRDFFQCVRVEGARSASSEDEKSSQSPLPLKDPLPSVLRNVVSRRLRVDICVAILAFLLLFALHCSSVFKVAQPSLHVSQTTV